jgi:GTPase SAR1 family protein
MMVLVNKRDLTTIKKNAITLSMMEEFQREHTDVLFYEVSARTGYNVEDAFKDLAQKLFDKGLNKQSSGFRLTANGSIKRGPNS